MAKWEPSLPRTWTRADLPPNVRLGDGSLITGDYITGEIVFKRFRSRRDPALIIGERSLMDGVFFNLGEHALVEIGDDCFFHDAFLICEEALSIGNRVRIGWHATIVDSDFHPADPARRLEDVVALSPLGNPSERPFVAHRAVAIEDDVWIGPNVTVLKGVRIGAGAIVEPGAVVTRHVAAGVRVLGNPARPVDQS